MDKINSSFEKGLSTEFSPLKQPQGTYPHAKHIVRDAQGTVISEPGTTLLADLVTHGLTNPIVIGEVEVEDIIIYFVVSDEGSYIIELSADNVLTTQLFTGGNGGGVYVPPVLTKRFVLNRTDQPLANDTMLVFEPGGSPILLDFALDETTSIVTVTPQQFGSTTVASVLDWRSKVSAVDKVPKSMIPLTTSFFPITNTASGGNWGITIVPGTDDATIQFGLENAFDPQGSGAISFSTFSYQAVPPANEIDTDLLLFSVDNPIDAIARKNYLGQTILYFTDGANIPRRIVLGEALNANNFDTNTKLFINPALPRVTNLKVVEGGGLPTGMYKFAARLATGSGNKTTFSQITQGIPIVDESQGGGEDQYDGASPQSPGGKSIDVTIKNIDINYDILEIAVITYTGEDNILAAHIVGEVRIVNDTVSFTYFSETQQSQEILLEELIQDAIEYQTADHILQKDNHLFLANVTTKDFTFVGNAMETLANNIEVHWFEDSSLIYEIPKRQGIMTDFSGDETNWATDGGPLGVDQGYVDSSVKMEPQVNTTFENYKNPDFTYRFKGYQRDEVYSFAVVPIFKGGVYGSAYHIPGDDTPGRVSDRNSAASETGTRLRGWRNEDGTIHHRMPSALSTEPVEVVEVTDLYSTQVYNKLGVEFKNIDIPTELENVLDGFAFVRQRRNAPGSGIVTTQGITKEFYNSIGSGLLPIPFNGRTGMRFETSPDWSGSAYFFGDLSIADDPADITNDINRNGYFAMYSPDILHGVVETTELGAINEVKQVAIHSVNRRADNRHRNPNSPSKPQNNVLGAFYQTLGSLVGDGDADNSNLHVPFAINSSATTKIEAFQSADLRSIPLGSTNVRMRGTTGFVGMQMATGSIPKERDKYPGRTFYNPGDNEYGGGQNSQLIYFFDSNADVSETRYHISSNKESLEIYNFYSYVNNVYGTLDTAEYILAGEMYFDTTPDTSSIQMFGGDTFISKYTFLHGEVGYQKDMIHRASIETYIETKGNYAYRQYTPTTFEGGTEIEGTMPYFPKYNILLDRDPADSGVLGLWDYDTSSGPGLGYNKHYNFENTLNRYYPVNEFFNTVSDFPNRTIYSLQSFENEQLDAYRIFLTNNFHDIPKETGEITNMFEYNNTLYLHTPHSLWRTYVNEKTFTNSTSGDIVLGNGGLFPIPSDRMYTQEGGYAGTSAKYGGVNTPYGRLFIDDHQKKIFMLIGAQKLEELVDPMMFQYFNNKLKSADAHMYRAGYDPLNKRMILSLDTDSISYSVENKSWSSFHDYTVDRFSSRDNRLVAAKGSGIWEIGTGNPGNIFGVEVTSELHIALNENPLTTKDFINMKWIQADKSQTFASILLRTEDFTTGPVIPNLVTSFADEQNFLPLGDQHLHLIGGEFRMTVPPDNNQAVGYTDELWRPTIKGKYGVIELTFNPGSTSTLELQYFITEYLKVSE